jgi:NAD(P)-dependent dehydrogenase (short-subunit alcohol dehydrogenase family)
VIVDLGVRGKGFLLVGGTAGMGWATARTLAAEGADLVLAGRDAERAEARAKSLRDDLGVRATAIAADVSHPDGAEALVDGAFEVLDAPRGLAVFTGTVGHSPLSIPDGEWLDTFEDVLMGTVRVVRAALPHLVARGGGTVVTTSAYSIHAPMAERIPYGALKGAVAVFTKGVAKSYGGQGIRANCVCPGAIETEAMHAMRGRLAEAKGIPYDEVLERVMVEDWKMNVALGRPGRPEEVGELVAFLLSERAGYLTGALVNIDGGTDF